MTKSTHDDGDNQQVRRLAELERELAAKVVEASPSGRARVASQANDTIFKSLLRERSTSLSDRCFGATASDPELVCRLMGTGKLVLEMGCGFGFVAAALARYQRQVVGVDISPFAVREASDATRQITNLQFSTMDASRLAFGDQTFDVAISIEVLEHLHPDDVEQHLQEVFRVLRPGGSLLIRTPNGLLGHSDVVAIAQRRGLIDASGHGFHLKEWTYSELTPLLYAAGFRRIGSLPTARTTYRNVRLPRVLQRLRIPISVRVAQERYRKGRWASINQRLLGEIKLVAVK